MISRGTFRVDILERKGEIEGRFCVALEVKVVQRAATKSIRIIARIASRSGDFFKVGIEPIWVGNTAELSVNFIFI